MNHYRELASKYLPTLVDGSWCNCVTGCPRKGYYRYLLELVPEGTIAPLSFGKAIHRGIEVWLKLGKPSSTDEALEAFSECYEYDGEDKRTPERGREILREYTKAYRVEPFKNVEVEIGFCLPLDLGVVTIPYGGRIDRLVRRKDTLYVLDVKTTSRLGLSWLKSWRPDISLTGYVWAVQEHYGESCEGVYIDGISTAGNPRDRFLRDLVPRWPWELEEFKGSVEGILIHWLHLCERWEHGEDPLKVFYKDPTTCGYYKGCSYKQLCLSQASELIQETNFKQNEWEPFSTEELREIQEENWKGTG